MTFDQPLQNVLPEVEEPGGAGVAEQPPVEDPQRERVLGVSLADPESRTCLHVALLSLKPDG